MFVKHFHLLKRTSSLAPEKITVNPPADTYLWSLCVCGVCQWHWALHVVLMTAGNTLDWAASVEEACYSSKENLLPSLVLRKGLGLELSCGLLAMPGMCWELEWGVWCQNRLRTRPERNPIRAPLPFLSSPSFMARWKKLPDLGHSQGHICQMEKQEHKEVLVY